MTIKVIGTQNICSKLDHIKSMTAQFLMSINFRIGFLLNRHLWFDSYQWLYYAGYNFCIEIC